MCTKNKFTVYENVATGTFKGFVLFIFIFEHAFWVLVWHFLIFWSTIIAEIARSIVSKTYSEPCQTFKASTIFEKSFILKFGSILNTHMITCKLLNHLRKHYQRHMQMEKTSKMELWDKIVNGIPLFHVWQDSAYTFNYRPKNKIKSAKRYTLLVHIKH